MKRCSQCGVIKEITIGFFKNKRNKNGYSSICKSCDYIKQKEYKEKNIERLRIRNRAYYLANKDKKVEYERNWRMMKRYGITFADKERMYAQQKGKCLICNDGGDLKKIHIDHNHQNGKVRGLLCYQCNSAIAFLKEDISILQKAIDYLKLYDGEEVNNIFKTQ